MGSRSMRWAHHMALRQDYVPAAVLSLQHQAAQREATTKAEAEGLAQQQYPTVAVSSQPSYSHHCKMERSARMT